MHGFSAERFSGITAGYIDHRKSHLRGIQIDPKLLGVLGEIIPSHDIVFSKKVPGISARSEKAILRGSQGIARGRCPKMLIQIVPAQQDNHTARRRGREKSAGRKENKRGGKRELESARWCRGDWVGVIKNTQ